MKKAEKGLRAKVYRDITLLSCKSAQASNNSNLLGTKIYFFQRVKSREATNILTKCLSIQVSDRTKFHPIFVAREENLTCLPQNLDHSGSSRKNLKKRKGTKYKSAIQFVSGRSKFRDPKTIYGSPFVKPCLLT